MRARAKLEPVTPSNPAHDSKRMAEVAEVSAEVTHTAQELLLVNHSCRKDQGMLGDSCLGVCVHRVQSHEDEKTSWKWRGTGIWVGETEGGRISNHRQARAPRGHIALT